MSIHKTRAACVDWAKTALAQTFEGRIYDRFIPILDLENASPMASQFPALVISIPSQEFDASLSGLVGIQVASQISFDVYGLVSSPRLYSPSEAVRADEVAKMRAVDEAAAEVFAALSALTPADDWQGLGFRLAAVIPESFSEEDQPADAPGVRYIISTVTVQIVTQE